MSQKIESELQFFSKKSREPPYSKALADKAILLMKLRPKALVLDAGCGEGYWGRNLAKHGYRTVGVDLSKEAIDRAERKAMKNQSFLIGNLSEKLPFTHRSFDAIFFGWVLHHFPEGEDIDKVIKNVSILLKKGGKLALIESNGSNPIVSLSRKIGRFLVGLYPDIATENETMHTVKTYINILKENDFEIQAVESCRHIVGRVKKIHNLLDLLFFLRFYLLDLVWKYFPQPHKGNEIIIIAKLRTL